MRWRGIRNRSQSFSVQWLGHLLRYATVTPNPSFPTISNNLHPVFGISGLIIEINKQEHSSSSSVQIKMAMERQNEGLGFIWLTTTHNPQIPSFIRSHRSDSCSNLTLQLQLCLIELQSSIIKEISVLIHASMIYLHMQQAAMTSTLSGLKLKERPLLKRAIDTKTEYLTIK